MEHGSGAADPGPHLYKLVLVSAGEESLSGGVPRGPGSIYTIWTQDWSINNTDRIFKLFLEKSAEEYTNHYISTIHTQSHQDDEPVALRTDPVLWLGATTRAVETLRTLQSRDLCS